MLGRMGAEMILLVGAGVVEVGAIEPYDTHADKLHKLMLENGEAFLACNETGQRQSVTVTARLEGGRPMMLSVDGPTDLSACLRPVLMGLEWPSEAREVVIPLDLVPLASEATSAAKPVMDPTTYVTPNFGVVSVAAKDEERAARVVQLKLALAAPCAEGARHSGTLVVSNTRGVLENGTEDTALATCVAEEVARWPFPPDAGSEIVITFQVDEAK
jgi:hypothetical protein